MKKTVLVLFGGNSTEYEISLCSAASVIRNIPSEKYDIVTLGITRNGEWYLYEGSAEYIENNTWQDGNIKKAVLSPDTSDKGLLVFDKDGIGKISVDIIFPVLHGKNGEDGTMQGLLELSGIPYVGCGHLSSAITMDKAFSNLIADSYGVKQAEWVCANRYDFEKRKEKIFTEAENKLGYPIFVKPCCAGSSVGVGKAKNRDELVSAAEKAFEVDTKIVFEECICGKEVEAAVLGNYEPIVSVPGEIVPCAEFYDYDAKYVSDSKLYIPAHISDETAQSVRDTALKVYKAFDCSGLSRVDFFVTDDGEIYFNEINTIPGFTKISMYAKLFDKVGIPYSELVDRLLTLAAEKRGL